MSVISFASTCCWPCPRGAAVFAALVALIVGLAGLMPDSAAAQVVVGRVVDARDGTALPGVSVMVEGTTVGTATDTDGRFRLGLKTFGVHVLEVRHLGFEPVLQHVDITSGEEESLQIKLFPAVIGAEEVVVSARAVRLEDAARSVETLDAATLREVRGQTFGDALRRLPGVTTLSTGPSIDKPVVRGLHSDRVVLINHGVRQEGQQWGREHAPEVDPFAPVEVSVVKGAAGVEYGAGAIGGVLRLTPEALPDAPGLRGSFDLDAFSNNRQGAAALRLEGAENAGSGVFAWRAHGSTRAAGASHTPDYVIGNSAFRENNLTFATSYRRDRWHLEAMASRFDSQLGIFSGAHVNTVEAWEAVVQRDRPALDYSFSYDIDAPRQEVTHDLVTVKGERVLKTDYRLRVQYGLQRNQRREYDAHSPGGGPPSAPGVELTLITHTTDVTLKSPTVDVMDGTLLWSVGASGMNQGNENGRASYLIPNYRALSGGAFARSTWSRGDWTVDAGARLDHQWSRSFPRDETDTDFLNRTHSFWGGSGVLSASVDLASAWSASLAASTAWRPPGFNEMYSDGVHHGSAQYEEGNSDLDAERAWGLDATLRHQGERTRLQVGGYETRIQDFIALIPSGEPKVTIRGVFPLFVYAQQNAVLRGVDGWAEADLLEPLTLGVTASLVRGTDRDLDRPLPDIPSERGSLFADLRLRHRPSASLLRSARLRVEGSGVRQQTRYPRGVDFAPPPGGYALLDVTLRTDWRWRGTPMSIQLGAENLFNTRYRDYLDRMRYFTDAPGRTFLLRLHVDV